MPAQNGPDKGSSLFISLPQRLRLSGREQLGQEPDSPCQLHLLSQSPGHGEALGLDKSLASRPRRRAIPPFTNKGRPVASVRASLPRGNSLG
eukprot:5436169-Alexandrium_andersonii.AAC.1